jgi:dipeptidyl aminopeptidase/acylaminoacyl peptidase
MPGWARKEGNLVERATYKFEQYFATRRIMDFAPTPDGSSVYFIADISGQYNLWRVPTAGGWPEQLTTYTDQSVRSVSLSKDGKRIAFLADPSGTEKTQVFLMEAEAGWPEQVTNRPDVQYEHFGSLFSPDGRYIGYSGNAAVPTDTDIYLRDLTTGEERQLTPGGRPMNFVGFTPDGKSVLALEFKGNTDQDFWLFDIATGEGRNLTAHAGQAKYFPGPWKKDGSGFYFYSDEGREFLAVGFYDVAAGRKEYVIESDWDVEGLALSGDGKLLAYVVNEAGNSTLRIIETETGKEVPLPRMPRGVIGALKFAGKDEQRRLFLLMGTYSRANAVHVLNLESGELQVLTPSMLGQIPEEAFGEPELVHIPAFDGLMIPAWLYRPRGVTPGEQVPAMLSIHGGPETQERPEYRYTGYYQYLLSQGVAVLAPNIRGSTGFGISYQKAIHRDWGGAELKDIEACARYLQSLEWVNSEKLAVWGGSFGGFATLSAATRLPDLWACACDFCGPSNLVTFAQSVPPHWKPMMKAWVGDPDEDRDLLVERSPITYVEQVRTPLMVVQGANDPRVVKAESDQMVGRLRSMGRTVEYMVFDDEGHGFTKRSNQLKGYAAMADFLVRHLKG